VFSDSFELKATEWIGANAENLYFPSYRTQAIAYGGTADRPISWLSTLRIPDSGIQAPCVTQAIGIDFQRPGSIESKALAQILGGFLFGVAAGLLVPVIDTFVKRVTARRRARALMS
jgi:hypothetical protein